MRESKSPAPGPVILVPGRRAVLALLVAAPLGVPRGARAAPDAQALLAASDAVRNPDKPFRVTVTISEYEAAKLVDSAVMVSYSRKGEDGGQFASLVRYIQPTRDAGKAMLKQGAELWFYDPGTKSTLRISPQQRLMGQASNGDVVTVNFARDYVAELGAEETIQDGERQQRRSYKLMLKARGEDATYGAIELWVDAENKAPLKARFFAESGRLLKTAYYRRFQANLGADRPTETVIIDGLNPKSVTILRLSDYAFRSAPANWFQRDYLPRFTAD